VPGYYARQDTKTPVKIAALTMAVNVALTLALGLMLAQLGIALALSIAGWVNALTLIAVLNRRGLFALDRRSRRALPRIALAALGMGGLVLLLDHALAGALAGALALKLAALVALIGGGLLGFAVLSLLLGVAEWRDLLQRWRRRAP